MKSAWMLGAGRVIGIDLVPERLKMAQTQSNAETIDAENEDVQERLQQMTEGRGPDRCIDAVGTEAHASGRIDAAVDRVKAAVRLTTDRVHVLREAIQSCRKAGTVSIAGVYIGLADKIPIGSLMNKGLTVRSGQTHVQRYMGQLLQKIEAGEIDPSFVITHRFGLEDGPAAYRMFRNKEDGCIKAVLKP
jgi:threonine dehydrogenase-like Zn-dependent dehydrogenase